MNCCSGVVAAAMAVQKFTTPGFRLPRDFVKMIYGEAAAHGRFWGILRLVMAYAGYNPHEFVLVKGKGYSSLHVFRLF